MRQTIVAIVLAASVLCAPAFGQKKSCEDLKKEIASKIEANGVKNYTLTIVTPEEVKDGDKVVGSCDGGTKRIVYKRG